MRDRILWAFDALLEGFEKLRINRNPHEVVMGLLVGFVVLVTFLFIFLKAQWFFAFAAWWACSELTKIRMSLQEEIAVRRAANGKDR